MTVPQKRIAWMDVARGLGIILVVYGHVLRGLAEGQIIQRSDPIYSSDYTIYTFHMPLFFLLAGVQVDRSLLKGRWSFLRGKLQTILYPYFLWSWFQLLLQYFLPKGMVNLPPHGLVTLVSIIWRPVELFWFLYVLFFCHLVAWATKARRLLLMPFLLAGLTGSAMIVTSAHPETHWFYLFIPWLVYYIAGILMSKPILEWRPGLYASIALTVGSAAAFVECVHFCRALSSGRPQVIYSWPAVISGTMMVLSASQLLVNGAKPLADMFGTLGRASMTIYIFHTMVAAGSRFALKKAHIVDWRIQLTVDTLVGVVVPFAFHVLLERKNKLAVLGLAPKRKTTPQVAMS